MGKTNSQVIQAWVYGNSAKSGNGNLSTDGQDLFSYAMKIGRRSPVDGQLEVLNVRGKKHSYSVTTSHHVSLAIYGSKGRLIEPVHTSRGYAGWRVFPIFTSIVINLQDDYKEALMLYENQRHLDEKIAAPAFQWVVDNIAAERIPVEYRRTIENLVEWGYIKLPQPKEAVALECVKPFDTTSFVIAYENGDLDKVDIIKGFQELVNSGLAWKLQGHYGRTANELIRIGVVTLPK